jgi:hypothetical protein
MSTAAARMRRRRAREREGKAVLRIEVDEIEVAEVLCAARLLDPVLNHSREDIARGIEKLLAAIARDGTTLSIVGSD